jgi:type IV pilus assembly protein PilY1
MSLIKFLKNSSWTVAVALSVALANSAQGAALDISNNPLFLNTTVPPLNMIIMGRDHKLYYEAYNDASDLDGDGTIDTRYKGYQLKVPAPPAPESPYKIDYFGYFDSFKCYSYAAGVWDPVGLAGAGKTCADPYWSGDYLNYLTTARVDALRKVMYGGDRVTDTTTDTILERTYIPQDAHSWGKEYTSVAVDGFNIADYTPLGAPAAGQKHFFANTTPRGTVGNSSAVYAQLPLLRQMLNAPAGRRVWNWVSKERPVAHSSGNCIDGFVGCPGITDYTMRIRVCKTGYLEGNCKAYPNYSGTPIYKPTGILQDYGEGAAPRMYFGLITGSYAKNTSGGVLRKRMGSSSLPLSGPSPAFDATNEIHPETGIINTGVAGIIATFNRMHPTGFRQDPNFDYTCGWITGAPITEGQCQMWGNPLAEMMFESLRYFAGRAAPLGAFSTTFGQGEEGELPGGGLPVASWDNPYTTQPTCAKPFQTVISDINPTYDTDQVPGSAFSGFSNSELSGLNVSTLGQTIWDGEYGGSRNVFIGQSGAVVNSAPTVKTATSFGNIRGLAPEDPTKLGGYYSASVAFYGHENDINTATGEQKVNTFSVALASPLPKIEIPVGTGRITLVPFAKSVAGSSINSSSTNFQPTNQIVDFYVDSITATSGRFRVNFEDVEQGADHDMDAIVVYEYTVSGSTVTVTLTSEYAAGGITQHMGYIISGSTRDGIYLEVVDQRTGDTATDPVDYYLDTPPTFTAATGPPPAPGTGGAGSWNDGAVLPFVATRTFTAGATFGAELLKNPLWYAARWGGFEDIDANGRPNLPAEWDENNDGTPDNYFLVTNALHLGQQLSNAFDEISERVGSASSASVNTGSISVATRVYQAKFNSGNWTGQLFSFPVQTVDNPATPESEVGELMAAEWEASQLLPAHGSRNIITINANSGAAVPFRWANIGATRQTTLQPSDSFGTRRLDYLRGDAQYERLNGGIFRNRANKLGDIVSSSPVFVGEPNAFYQDSLEAVPYSSFVTAQASRPPMVYAGANDGMLHAFNATTGVETLGFIPNAVWPNLIELTRPNYTHRFFVDGTPTVGDAFYGGGWHTVLVGGLNKGGRSVYALDVTNPGSFSESNAASIFRWEFTDTDLGYTYSAPSIVRLPGGTWVAVFGNGYNLANTGTGTASLYIVNIETGALIKKIDTGVGSPATPNGLATPTMVDIDGDDTIDFAYAGDLQGNMWKFKFPDSNVGNWDVAYISSGTRLPLTQVLDSAGVAQPITSAPEVGRGPQGVGTIVLFGTGRFLQATDKAPTQTQSFYGIFDPNSGALTDRVTANVRSKLTQQQITAEQNVTFTSPSGATVSRWLRTTTRNPVASSARGWYLDLLQPGPVFQGEMQVSDSILRNGRIIFTTLIPDQNPCSPGGTSWLMELDALGGTALADSPFDNNNDGVFSDADFVNGEAPAGQKSEVGIGSSPGILDSAQDDETPDGMEWKYISGTTPNAAGSNIQKIVERAGANARGRQSWRQVK